MTSEICFTEQLLQTTPFLLVKKVIDYYPFAAVVTSYDYLKPEILYANGKHTRLTGFRTEDVVGQSPKIFQGKNTSQKVKDDMKHCLSVSSFWHGDVINYRKDGEEIALTLLIFAIKHNEEKFYVVLKKKAD